MKKKGVRLKAKGTARRQGAKETGQSATESIMFLGVVLIIAIVSVSLLGGGIDKSSGVSDSSFKILWSRQSPVSVTEWSVDDGKLEMEVENKGSYPVKVTSLMGGNATVAVNSTWIQTGEKTVLPQVSYQSLNPSSSCGEYGSTPGTLIIPDFGIEYDQSVSTGGEAIVLQKVQQVDAPLTIQCNSPDPQGWGIPICETCKPSESCCTAPSDPLQYYCFDPSKYSCESIPPCDKLGWDNYEWAGCPNMCPGGCNPQLGACCISTHECMAAGSSCDQRPFLICYADLNEWFGNKCCVDTYSIKDGSDPCNIIACEGGTCNGNTQACCYDGDTGMASCMDNGNFCKDKIACGGDFCRPAYPYLQECCLATHMCVPIGTCGK